MHMEQNATGWCVLEDWLRLISIAPSSGLRESLLSNCVLMTVDFRWLLQFL